MLYSADLASFFFNCAQKQLFLGGPCRNITAMCRNIAFFWLRAEIFLSRSQAFLGTHAGPFLAVCRNIEFPEEIFTYGALLPEALKPSIPPGSISAFIPLLLGVYDDINAVFTDRGGGG